MKYALIQTNPLVGDIEGNAAAILEAACSAARAGAQLCVTPELALIGYPPRDLLLFPDLVDRAEAAVADLTAQLAETAPFMALVLGSIGRNAAPRGKPLFNQALFISEGAVRARYSKQLLPTYDVFDESRYFEPGTSPVVVDWRGRRIALTVCEDIWNASPSSPKYTRDPVQDAAPFDLLINLSASPFTQGKQSVREAMLAELAGRHRAEVLYVNQAGGNDELIFDGRSMRVNASGRLTHRARPFAEDLLLVDETPRIAADDMTAEAEIWQALVLGTRDYIRKNGMRGAVLGLSGGVDSALVAAIACEALGPGNVTGILMPSPWSSAHSLDDAEHLAANLGMPTRTIPIAAGMEAFEAMLAPGFSGTRSDVTEENIQARIRGILLMAQSNKFGPLLLTTGNKSELSVGYCTIYGDMCGGLAVIADLLKTEVYRLCRWRNRHGAVIPENILTKAPSAELRPGQTDQDSLPPYDVLDEILDRMLVRRQSFVEICASGHDPQAVRLVATLVRRSEFKRRQAAPGLKITEQAFGVGWRMPLACLPPYTVA